MVFCAEWPDNNGKTHGLILADDVKLTSEFRKDMLGGIEVIQAKALAAAMDQENKSLVKAEHKLLLIPYYAWAHRGTGEMDVWLARNDEPINAVLKEQQRKQEEKERKEKEKKERDEKRKKDREKKDRERKK